MTRNIFVNDDAGTAFIAVDLAKNLGFGLWNIAKTVFYVGGVVSETYSGISQVILNDSKKSAEHFSDAKTDIIEVKNSIMDVCKNLSNIVLDSIGIGYDVANGVISAGNTLASTVKSIASGAIEIYDNWNDQDVFYDASDTTQEEVEIFYDAPLASHTDDIGAMGLSLLYSNDSE